MAFEFELHSAPSAAEADQIIAGLIAFNKGFGLELSTPLTILVRRKADESVCGGLRGKFAADWLIVEQLWIADEMRGQGAGAAVMAAAEVEARKRGCVGVHLDTHTFQAPGFYERLGYLEFGRVEDHPRGHARVFYAKRLITSPE